MHSRRRAAEGEYDVIGTTFHLHARTGEHADGQIVGGGHHLELSGHQLWPAN